MMNLENIVFQYANKPILFDQLNLVLSSGKIYGLLGENGAGKTTLLKLIAGLLFPQSGTCKIAGVASQNRSPKALENLYFIPEAFLIPPITIAQYQACYEKFYTQFSREQFKTYLAQFELSSDQLLSALSYGQKKKFLIAFGLATNASILLLDEPTNGLDIPSKSQCRKLLAGCLDAEKMIFISTHQVKDIENLIDTVLILKKGKIIYQQAINLEDKVDLEKLFISQINN